MSDGSNAWKTSLWAVIERSGAPTIIICVLALVFGRPLVNAHVANVDANTSAVKSLADSVRELTRGVDLVVEVERESQDFMRGVIVEHSQHGEKLDTIIRYTEP